MSDRTEQETKEKLSRALDSYLFRTGRITTHTSPDWLIEDLEAEGLVVLHIGVENFEGQKKILTRFAHWLRKEPPYKAGEREEVES